jgi:type IV pilus assembly protein PilW
MGCSNPSGGLTVNNNVDPTSSHFSNNSAVSAAVGSYTGTDAIQGYSYTTGALPTELSGMGLTTGSSYGDVMENTDILFIRRARSCPGGSVVSHNNASASMQIEDNSTCGIQQNDLVMVSNCQTADIFGVTNVVNSSGGASHDTIAHGANLNISPQLANGYGADSFIYRMQSEVYFIGVGASGEPALFKSELRLGDIVANELVEGIEDMTILYGEDRNSDGNPDIYVNAASVLNMDNVISVRITVDARTVEDNIATSTTAAGDRRIRRSFTTTVGIRNRMT